MHTFLPEKLLGGMSPAVRTLYGASRPRLLISLRMLAEAAQATRHDFMERVWKLLLPAGEGMFYPITQPESHNPQVIFVYWEFYVQVKLDMETARHLPNLTWRMKWLPPPH